MTTNFPENLSDLQNESVPENIGPDRLLDEIRERLNDRELIAEHDSEIARDIIDRLDAKYEHTNEKYYEALKALDLLIPKWTQLDVRRFRQIAGVTISPGIEKLIQSRNTAEIVDIDYLENLPPAVRDEVIKQSALIAETTDACTVGCDFCPVAHIGPIQKRLSFRTILNLFQVNTKKPKDFQNNQPEKEPFSTLWNNNDAFDWEGKGIRGQILDYTDLLKAYIQDISKGKIETSIFHSTAIPWGSELRILKALFFLVDVPYKEVKEKLSANQKGFRISSSPVNEVRANAIQTLLHAIYPEDIDHLPLIVDPRNDKRLRFSGKGRVDWQEKAKSMTLPDVLSINCYDSVVFTAQGIRNDISVAMSNERTNATESIPFKTLNPDGSSTYRIVHYANYGNFLTFPRCKSFLIPTMTIIHCDKSGKVISNTEEAISNNPHRCLFAICYLLDRGIKITGPKRSDNFDSYHTLSFTELNENRRSVISQENIAYILNIQPRPEELTEALELIRQYARVIKQHLDSGHDNPVMSMVLSKISPLLTV